MFKFQSKPAKRFAKLGCDAFEERNVPAVIVPAFPLFDVSQVAALYPRHDGPTDLYLNFDGSNAEYISPFETTTGSRSRDIQEILFRSAEIFAPFDVQVHRISGNGNRAMSDGASTIFIGDKLGNTEWYEAPDGSWSLVNKPYAYAPNGDRPSIGAGFKVPNSNAYDIAFVDPVSFKASSATGGQPTNVATWGNDSIARAVGHEAGHTFGLTHIFSVGNPDIMNYGDDNIRFLNKSLPVTTLNYNGTETLPSPTSQPIWAWNPPGPVPFQQIALPLQNSYAHLMAALGSRALDFANVANANSVDAGYVDGALTALSWNGGSAAASIGREGDYDVYTVSSPSTRWLEVKVSTPNGYMDPVVFITNGSGTTRLAFDDDGGTQEDSRVVFRATAGTVYKIVVGGYDGNSTGGYHVSVNEFDAVVNPAVLPGIGDLSNGLPDKDFVGVSANAGLGFTTTARYDATFKWKLPPFRFNAGGEAFGEPVVPFNPVPDFAPLPVIPGKIDFANGVLSIVGTNADDAADVRYVVFPGGAVSLVPTPWIRANLDTPFGDFTGTFPTQLVSKIDFQGKLGDDAFQNATSIATVAEGSGGNDVLITGGGNDIVRGGDDDDVIFGGGGADYLEGNAGHDHLFGGTGTDHLIGDGVGQSGDDVLFGEDGDDALEGRDGSDVLNGGNGRDVLIGGAGRDDLSGGAGDDLLIGGSLAFPILGEPVLNIGLEWSSAHDYASRVRNLRGIDHAGFGARLNADTFLQKGTTVIDDGAFDDLVGGAGQDWFVIGPFDATDDVPGEQVL